MQALPALAALALTTAARAGLLHMTDLRADPERRIHSEVADAVEPPFVYAAVVTTLARRPGPAAFVDFLMAAQGSVLLAAHGLEKASS
jgi:ABC-type molybdate transport system substrate-binding protein